MAKTSEKADVHPELALSGELCLAFANTAATRRDQRLRDPTPIPMSAPLDTYGALVAWGREMGVLEASEAERLGCLGQERTGEAAATLDRALQLRSSLVRIFTAVATTTPVSSGDLEVLNGFLAAALPARQVVWEGGFRLAWRGDENALDRMLWPVVVSATELLVSNERGWVRQCADEHCPRLFIDRRSRLRKWCDPNTRGSRVKSRRFY